MSTQRLYVGVDVGGTKLQVALIDGDGRILHRQRRPTRVADGPDAVVADVVTLVREAYRAAGPRPILGVGAGVAGQVDPPTGRVVGAPNLGWRDYPFLERLQAALAPPVAVLNDVQAVTVAELAHGAGRGARELVCLFVGTGIGGGVVTRGQLMQGCGGSAAEFGHITIDLHGPRCRCGNNGCLEALAGGWAIARRARESAAADPHAGATILALAGGTPEGVTAGTVAEAARRGDPLASTVVRDAGEALGAGVASIVNAFNPCLLLLGGGVLDGLPELLDVVRAAVRTRALAAAARVVRIERAALGPDAGSIGAAVWAERALVGQNDGD